MSSHEAAFSYSVSFSSLWPICQQAFEQMEKNGWKITIEHPTQLIAKQSLSLLSASNPITVAALISSASANESKIEYKASNFGLGPLQTRACRKVVEDLHQKILSSAEAEREHKLLVQLAEQEGMMCPTCGTLVEPGVKFCPNDGTQIGKRCGKCATNNKPNARFCINCGQLL